MMELNHLTHPASGSPTSPTALGLQPRAQDLLADLERWHLRPIESLCLPSDGFAILSLLFPLLEKWLRFKDKHSADFTEGCKPLRRLGRMLNLDDKQSARFWGVFRNGTLHQATPKAGYVLVRDGSVAVSEKCSDFIVDPFKLRDLVLSELRPDLRSLFKGDSMSPVARVYESAP